MQRENRSGVRRYATSYDVLGTVRMHNVGVTLRDLVIEDNATIGLFVGNDRATVDNLTVRRNGLLGMSITTAYGTTFSDSLVTDNNTEHFNGSPVAGGVKVTRTRGIVMSNVDTSRNIGSGTWFDESCYDVKILDVTSNDNTEIGIHAELSSKVTIARSQAFDNREGIRIFDTENVLISNNDLGNNSRHDLNLMQDERRQATHKVGRDPRVPGVDPTVTWITRNITIRNNVFGAGGPRAIFAHDTATGRAVDTWNVTIDGNLFSSAAGGPSIVTWGGSGCGCHRRSPSRRHLHTAGDFCDQKVREGNQERFETDDGQKSERP
ncbi:right-handed parallel beta-helix repeat-containing protein, partial [Microbacterium sp. BF1]|uniref:right-handed parallel beta-helix repeat-containing protein n=1 Tax=Microbacterium sp. BF1 TaxID=2821146 RepID=UPI001C4DDA1F